MEAMQKIKCLTIEDSNFPDRLKNFRNAQKTVLHRKPARSEEACCCSGRVPACAVLMADVGHLNMQEPWQTTVCKIISGMARGIDAEGHKGALDTDTPTFAVLGSGVDVCYPNSNRWLYQRILEKAGGIISELPPEQAPVNWAFPARNRIISALSDAVLVVEAKEQSGSLITANFALEHGHSVYARSGGCDR